MKMRGAGRKRHQGPAADGQGRAAHMRRWAMSAVHTTFRVLLRLVAGAASTLCALSARGFAATLSLSAERPWLLPVTIVLLPCAAGFAIIALVTYPLAALAGFASFRSSG